MGRSTSRAQPVVSSRRTISGSSSWIGRAAASCTPRPPPSSYPSGSALCDFANEPVDCERFIQPVIRAILLRFWPAYDHPFEDGNGRTARALFTWSMRTHGYRLVEYLSISGTLADAPAQYGRAFLLRKTDERDTTYFLVHQLNVIQRAVTELHDPLERKGRGGAGRRTPHAGLGGLQPPPARVAWPRDSHARAGLHLSIARGEPRLSPTRRRATTSWRSRGRGCSSRRESGGGSCSRQRPTRPAC